MPQDDKNTEHVRARRAVPNAKHEAYSIRYCCRPKWSVAESKDLLVQDNKQQALTPYPGLKIVKILETMAYAPTIIKIPMAVLTKV